MGSVRGTTKALGKKHKLDKFYTKPSIAQMCVNTIPSLDEFDLIIEPSAGNGSFSNLLVSDNYNVLALDITPESPKIVQQDWFEYKKSSLPTNTTKVLVVGNPPFGTQGNLAVKFINHAEKIGAHTVAFVLPKSFRKHSIQNRISTNLTLIKDVELPLDSFTLDGASYPLPCVFQIWQRTDTPRVISKAKTTTGFFSFVKKDTTHDFAIRRVGGRAGTPIRETKNLSEQSNYFIKVIPQQNPTMPHSSYVQKVFDTISKIDFINIVSNSVGPRTLSKGELVQAYEKTQQTP